MSNHELRLGGVAVNDRLMKLEKPLIFKEADRWILAASNQERITSFSSKAELQSWWKSFKKLRKQLTNGESAQGSSKSLPRSRNAKRQSRKDTSTTSNALPEPSTAARNRLLLIMQSVLAEWEPRIQDRSLNSKAFWKAVKATFHPEFLDYCLLQLRDHVPQAGDESVAWFYRMRRNRKASKQSLKKALPALAQLMEAKCRNGKPGAQTATRKNRKKKKKVWVFEHRPVGGPKPGGRWGA